MTLIENWKKIAPKLWSIRLAIAAAILSGIEVGYTVYLTGKAPIFAAIACLVSIAAAVARLIAQPGLFPTND